MDDQLSSRPAGPRAFISAGRHRTLHRCRRILVRWEKKAENYLAMVESACA